MRFSTFCATAATVLLAGFANAQSNLVLLISQPGDYIGQGQTYVTTNPASFSLSGTPSLVSVDAFGYLIRLDGPGSTNLAVGQYTNAARYPFNGNAPGLSVSGNGRGCNTVCGFFDILELETNGVGQVEHFWATFTHICECTMAPMTGEIRYNSQLAPPAPVPKTLLVPSQYSTIQAAINNASPLAVDTILVAPGVYNEAVDFKGRRVQVISVNGPTNTIIRPPSGATGVNFSSGETAEALLAGFTVTNAGTGISVSSSSPTIVSNLIVNCSGGINVNFASPVIRSNRIIGSTGDGVHLGGAATPVLEGNLIKSNSTGISMWAAGAPLIRNNLIQSNRADGLNLVNGSDANIIQNIIVGNVGSGISWLTPSGTRGPFVVNNTIAKNIGPGISADGYDAAARIINNIIVGTPAILVGGFNDANPPIIQFNNVYSPTGAPYSGLITNLTGIAGNLSADPLFVCFPTDDYHLLGVSPCVDAGTNGAPQLPATDYDGAARIQDGNTNGVAVADMGVFELNPAALPLPCLYIACPTNIVVAAAAGQNSAVVNYPPATGTPVATITGLPPSGSVFPGGTNIVTCTATYGTNSVSCAFTVTVLVPPAITNQPLGANAFAGQPFSLIVGATGSSPLSYRWTFEGNTIAGATSSTLAVANAQAINEGIYRAIVTNQVGSVTSASVFVRVFPAGPTIVSNPASLVLPASSNAAFTVAATGTQPLSYQWLFNNTPVAGATLSQYILNNVQSGNSGNYRAFVSNILAVATSAVATLTVTSQPPYFVTHPAGATLAAGSSYTFAGLARGSEPLSYQWQRDGVNLAGAAQSSLPLTALGLTNSGGYSVVASNVAGMTTSLVAQLTIYQPPALTQGLTNQVVDAGSLVQLAVAVSASPAAGYSWQFNGAAIPGTNSVLNISNIQAGQSGYYRVTAANQYGSISSTGRVSVLGPASWVIAWGDNSGGQTNVPPELDEAVSVAAGDYHTVALRRGGSLVAWGYNGDGQTNAPSNALRFVSVAAGGSHNLAMLENGSVVAWGRNDFGQRNVPGSATAVLALAAGESHSLALLSAGTIVGWGDNSFNQATGGVSLNGVRAIAAGRNHSLALRTNGIVAGWGFNAYGQASPPGTLSNVTAIAAGYLHSVALLSNGTVVVWGDNTFGQTNVPPGASNVVAIATGDFHTLALKANGSVMGWGDDGYGQTDVPSSVTNVANVAAGYYHGLALVPVKSVLVPTMTPAGLLIQWNGPGVLQWSPIAAGAFTDIPGLWRSYTNSDFSAPTKFFRLRR